MDNLAKEMKGVKEDLAAIKNLLILQLLQGGASPKQIGTVLAIKNVAPSNIPKSFPIKRLRKEQNDQ